MTRLALALLLVAACKGDPRPPPGTGSRVGPAEPSAAPGAQIAAETSAETSPEVAALPGVLWFVAERPHRLIRLAAGARQEVTSDRGELFPSAAQLPDGRLIAIASRGDGSPDAEQLVLIAADGARTALGPEASQVRDPVVVEGGAAIVAAIRVEGQSDLYRIAVPGGAMTRLTRDKQGNFRPARLGDDAIVFVSSRDGDSEVYRSTATGGAVQRLTAFHRDDWDPSPSPDGHSITFISDREGPPRLFVVGADGTSLRRLTARGVDGDERELEERELVWSRDGAWSAYVLARGGKTQVVLRATAGGGERILTPVDAIDLEPAFSPDGRWLVVSRAVGGETDLWAIPTGAGEPVRITTGAGAERLPRWQ